jgi:hypothetical protein
MTSEQLQNEAVARVEAWLAQSGQDSDRAMEHALPAVRDPSEMVQLDGKHFEYDGLHRRGVIHEWHDHPVFLW